MRQIQYKIPGIRMFGWFTFGAFLAWVACVSIIVYVAWHFISKWW